MTHENAQRRQSARAIHSGLHLVYSRDWSKDRRMRAIAQHSIQPIAPRRAPQSRAKHLADTGTLAAAALVAPFIWACHALLQHVHIL